MPTFEVSDREDPRLRPFADLPRRGPGGGEGRGEGESKGDTIVVEGELAVARALESDYPVRAVLLTPQHRARLGTAIPEDVLVLEASAPLVREVVGFPFHRGCVAVMDRPRALLPSELHERVAAWPAGPRRVLVAEHLADPANLGAVIRNARAFGVDLLLHGRGADPWSRRAIRAAMGLGFSLPVVTCDDLPAAVVAVRQALGPRARTVAAIVQPGAVPLPDYRAPERMVLLVGNEGLGLSEPLRALADDAVTIPLATGVDSLNVAAATAVLLWSLRR
jgi:tRNA G18 (ribose-2'-O)-methylase SpoU